VHVQFLARERCKCWIPFGYFSVVSQAVARCPLSVGFAIAGKSIVRIRVDKRAVANLCGRPEIAINNPRRDASTIVTGNAVIANVAAEKKA